MVYPLIPIVIIIFMAYITTLIFTGWKVFPVSFFRKFWNYLLLIAFLVSGLLGLLSVIKVNYKLTIPAYDTFLNWHVSFGIALVFIAFIHMSWHLKYYFSFRKKTKKVSDVKEMVKVGQYQLKWLLFLLGMVAIISQVVFIREFITVLSGNELVVGIVMAAWMLLTGLGAFYSRKGNFDGFTTRKGVYMLSALTLYPMVLIVLLYLLKNLLFPPGTMVHFGNSVFAVFLLLSPVCFLSGYLFTLFSTLFSVTGKSNLIGKSYAFESLGSLLGGAFFSIFLGRYFNSFQVFGISFAIVFLSGAWLCRGKRFLSEWKMILVGVFIPVLVFVYSPEKHIKKMLFPNQELVFSHTTRYGNLVVTQQAGQVNVYENNNLQFYTDNIMLNEEAVHFAMVQHDNPKQVLLISGGIAGMIDEIRKYDVEKITYLESNPEIFRLPEIYTEAISDTTNFEIFKKDIRRFISGSKEQYDVILINLPPPSSLGLNRFYTEEFFNLLKKHGNSGTVICTSLPSTANYAEENALEANASLWKTLGLFFKNQLLLTGEKNYFLASDSELSSSVTEKIAKKNIQTKYVNQYYMDDMLLSMRSETLLSQLPDSVPVNMDFYPFLFVKQIGHWLDYFGTRYRLLILVPSILFLLLFFRTNRITAGLYTGGFTAASLEVALLLVYQVYFGSIYLTTALFFAIFMAGLALGSSIKYEIKPDSIKSYYLLQFGLAIFAVILPFLIRFSSSLANVMVLVQVLIFVLIFILATTVGFEFLLVSRLRKKSFSEISGSNYGTDLAGSAFGAFLTAIVLLPFLGLEKTCFIVAGLNIISGLLAFSARKSQIF